MFLKEYEKMSPRPSIGQCHACRSRIPYFSKWGLNEEGGQSRLVCDETCWMSVQRRKDVSS